MEHKKYTELELYMLLRLQAKLVEQTKHTVLDQIMKTGVSSGKNVSIFTLLGILMDLQKLNVIIVYPDKNKDKISFDDLIAFMAKNNTKMHHTSVKIQKGPKKLILNWILLNTAMFEIRFADFIDYFLNDLNFNLILPNTLPDNNFREKLKSDDDSLMLSIEAKLKKQRKELDLLLGK